MLRLLTAVGALFVLLVMAVISQFVFGPSPAEMQAAWERARAAGFADARLLSKETLDDVLDIGLLEYDPVLEAHLGDCSLALTVRGDRIFVRTAWLPPRSTEMKSPRDVAALENFREC